MELSQATALVTGANRGIGRAIVEALAERPLRLILAGVRDPDAFEPVTGRAEVRAVRLDLSDRGSIEESIEVVRPELSQLDLLINNAGRMTGGLLEEQAMDEVYAMFQVNLVAVAHLTHLVLPYMLSQGRGKIVNNASISGYAHFPAASTYAASKAGVVAFSESLRRELKGTGVDVLQLVTPGVDTDMLDATVRGLRPPHRHRPLGEDSAERMGLAHRRGDRGRRPRPRPRRQNGARQARFTRPRVLDRLG